MSQRNFESILLDTETRVLVEISDFGGEQEVASQLLDFESVTKTIEKIARTLLKPIKAAAPQKASIEFGLDMGIESGNLTAIWVKGTGSASLRITLEWEDPKETGNRIPLESSAS